MTPCAKLDNGYICYSDAEEFMDDEIEVNEETGCRHTKSPDGYVSYHDWTEMKSKTHKQIRCPVCGLWAVWVKKETK